MSRTGTTSSTLVMSLVLLSGFQLACTRHASPPPAVVRASIALTDVSSFTQVETQAAVLQSNAVWMEVVQRLGLPEAEARALRTGLSVRAREPATLEVSLRHLDSPRAVQVCAVLLEAYTEELADLAAVQGRQQPDATVLGATVAAPCSSGSDR